MKRFLIILFLFSTSLASYSQTAEKKAIGEKKALFIYNFSKYIEWPNIKKLKEFKIGIMGDDYNYIFNGLEKIAAEKNVNDIPLKIVRVNFDTKLDELQVLYFDDAEKYHIKDIQKKTKKAPVLLVSEHYPYGQSMINFIMINDKIEFELNEEKCNAVGLKVNIAIKTIAIKTKRDWESLTEKMETLSLSQNEKVVVQTKDLEALLEQQKKLTNEIAANKSILENQKKELAEKAAMVEASNKMLDERKATIQQQQAKIALQENSLNDLNFTITAKQIRLAEQQEILEKEQKKLIQIKSQFAETEKELTEKEQLVKDNEAYIQNQYKIIETKTSTIEEQKNIIWLSVIFLIVVSVLGLLAYRSYKLKKKANILIVQQKVEIEAQHKEIRDSIDYAKRIQQAIIPPIKVVQQHLKDCFVIYQPKDVVSGDFYWLESPTLNVIANTVKQSDKNEEELIFFAACDCTGHGVPGAMVSVICNNALKRSVNEFKLTTPGEILDRTREIVVQEFEKSEDEVKDGMDIALCSLQLSESSATLQYAGANNSLYIISKNTTGENELIEIKPNKQSIGKVDNPTPFTTHNISLKKGDTIYVFTDGYADQFGGEKGKKMMYKPFKNLLLAIQDKSMSEQKIILEQHFKEWKGGLEQVDDVCIIGVRI
ncbi:MAG: YfiR/HmsC family protein [Flavobacteriales bacterium]|nr:YfiR/HmsC family protein [Flavobacteriales bacterium]MCW8912059.1 YfiR/HmsC family protein [Flavobacteriales bacterium]MCW8936699.1 YfiR/HmsC family protein [Flavobacteriales bacterium]MCW8967104.1 YfiR/HmsC family protein [Flavobacteriales bacterium]MCW8990481.1 YfiR/HmsC family protein [Flavobacteriales bacterium]